MIHKAKQGERLLIRSMGRSFTVTAIATSDDEANAHMTANKDDAVIACFGPFVIIANKYDKGIPVNN